jgi:hypothetical protein
MYLVLVVAEATTMFQIIQGGTIEYRDLAKITQVTVAATATNLTRLGKLRLRLCDRSQLRRCGQCKKIAKTVRHFGKMPSQACLRRQSICVENLLLT